MDGEPGTLELPTLDPSGQPAQPVEVDSTGWPIAIPGLGSRQIGSCASCYACDEETWARYGGRPHCKHHALQGLANDSGSKTYNMNSESSDEGEDLENHEAPSQ